VEASVRAGVAVDRGANIATVMAAPIRGMAQTPSAARQPPPTAGTIRASIVATGMISPMISPLV
jgi:hypothetical protein